MPRSEPNIRLRADGRYEARLMHEGKRVSYFGRTVAEVKTKIHRARVDVDEGRKPRTAGRLTVSAYLRGWHEKRPYKSYNTQLQYGGIVRELAGAFGSKPLTALTADAIEAYLAGVRLSARSKQYRLAVLRAALEAAVKRDLLIKNPAAQVEGYEAQPREFHILTPAEQDTLLTALRGDRLYAAYVLSLALALRPGETLGLTWDDVDFERSTVKVHRNLARVKGGWELKPRTKTGRAALYTLPDNVMDVLREHRQSQLREAHSLDEQAGAEGTWRNPLRLVFTTLMGGAIDQGDLRRDWYAHLERAGLPRTRPYSMRHSALTQLSDQGVDLPTLAALARHSRPSVTANVYLHSMPESVSRAIASRKLPE